jgi:hypothetical protein
MGKSHQAGWVVLRGKRWYGYFRKRVLNPITNEEEAKPVCIPLNLKSKMTKSDARDALRVEVTKQTDQNLAGIKVLKDSSTTFGWFVRKRYFPLREGDWRPETAKVEKIQIEQDLLAKFEEYSLDSIDRFMVQTHLNNLAEQMSQDRVKQARPYLKSIFDEVIEQEFLTKDPSRKLRIPKNLQPKDKQVLTAFIFPNSRGGFMDTGNYRNRVLNPLAEKLGLPKLNFQVMRRTMATQAQSMGSVKDIQAHLRHAKADTTANEYMRELRRA